MTSGKPLLSSSDSHPHLLDSSLRINSLAFIHHNTSSPTSSAAAAAAIFDDTQEHTSSSLFEDTQEHTSSSLFEDTQEHTSSRLHTLKEDESYSNFSPLRGKSFPDNSVRHSPVQKEKEFRSAELRFHQEFQLECPRERKPLVSWGGSMDTHHDIASFEVSTAHPQVASSTRVTSSSRSQIDLSRHSSRVQDKLNKSQRIRHKSMQFEDNLMHQDNPRLIHINDPKKTNNNFDFSGNEIRTSKYTFFNFLPKNLFIQFHRVAYLYFLAIAALNQLPPLAVFGRTVSLFPLLFVLSVTAIKDGYEDWRRHRSDRNENNREALVLQAGEFQVKRWKKMQAGEVVKICADETIPCDMVLLGTSDPSGIAYIQTMNLDGESNLKTRYARQETSRLVLEGTTIAGVIRCEQPNRNIYEFTANMEIKGQRFSLSQSNIILRGCQLKNTEWAIGVVVYAGQETKAMLNSAASPSKRSRLETYMNRETFWLSVFLLTMCLVVGIGMGLWLKRHKNQLETLPYYRSTYSATGKSPDKPYKFYGIPMEAFFSFLSSIIVFQIMIPISLYITMELVRLGQSYFMIGDRHMYDNSTGSRFQCRSLNINEDLGQIRYVFSDKTGTLTENKMEFRRASVYGKSYGRSLSTTGTFEGTNIGEEPKSAPLSQRRWKLKSEITADFELLELLHKELSSEERAFAHEFFLTLSACNTVIPILPHSPSSSGMRSDLHDGVVTIDYQGESPDEQALVAAASAYGYTLFERTSGHIAIDVNGEKLRLDVLGLHEFDSVRKRMSVVVRFPNSDVKVLVKGADTSMFGILKKDAAKDDHRRDATQSHLTEYSSEGLRTLVVASRNLTTEELEEWQCMYQDASTSLTERTIKLRQTALLIECNLTLLGATAIEDKLQDGVPEAIESLRQAGIKVWVLTGDKQETAISIGLSCKLLTTEMQQIIINGNSENECRKLLFDAKAKYGLNHSNQHLKWIRDAERDYLEIPVDMKFPRSPQHAGLDEGPLTAPLALIIDGSSLVYILEKDLELELFDIATSCRVVLCCRVAPLQKAGIVDLIKSRTDDMTLAIGDGANDVSMIQMADVGVGICGQEGRQAVMASDFAMGQFRFLKRLLLVHGHWNYQRIGYLVLYNFYRNAVFVLMLFWYILCTAFSTTSALTDWSSVFYSVIYTSLPTIVVGILDKDLGCKTLLQYPKLYAAGHRQETYNMRLFWITMIDTLWQSLVLFYVPLFTYRDSTIDIWSMGSLWTVAVVILVNIHLAMDVQRWVIYTHLSVWGSIIITYGCVLVLDSIPAFANYGTIYHLAKSPTYWLSILLITVLGLLPRFVLKAAHVGPAQFKMITDCMVVGSSDKGVTLQVMGAQNLHPPKKGSCDQTRQPTCFTINGRRDYPDEGKELIKEVTRRGLKAMLIASGLASASIHEYEDEGFTPQSNAFIFLGGTEGLYAASNQPKSFIRFETVSFVRTKDSAQHHNEMQSRTGLIEAIILEVKDRERIGDVFSNSHAICCAPKLSQDKFCTVGEVIIQKNPDNPQWPIRIQTFFQGKNQEAKMDTQSLQVNSTGMYYLYFMFCDPQLKGTVIRGKTVWRNPQGYLPGKMVPLMTFYGFASLAYLLLGLIWFLRFVQFWKDIIQLHYHITAVIALGMCEMAPWYFEYANLNATGTRPRGITLWAVTITAFKKTVSRLLLLVVSMGYGVVKPTFGGGTSKMILLGVLYFVAAEVLELVEHLGNINDFSGKTKLYLVLPVAFLDAWFILWIFSSLSKTLEKLQTRKNVSKLELYRKFTNSLAVFVLLSIAWVGYELYFKASDPLSELWRIAWMIPAFWTLLEFFLLVVICVLWAPSNNPTRYAYSGETGDEYDEESISLTSGVKVVGEVGIKLERKEKKGSSASVDQVTEAREDLDEEDKLE
ncbi:hypothetical protein ACH5RR_005078 [Cinchona calisaya]|uniref:P-type phospholipid transporter n=1 Tax=Cinchona calisaya TaxID=153742 RepID=A0ABD3AZC3_9GENT